MTQTAMALLMKTTSLTGATRRHKWLTISQPSN